MPKIKYGICNVHYALLTFNAETGAPTFGTVKPLKGARSISLNPQGEMTKFFADNIVYWAGNSNSGYSGSLELALVPDDFKVDVLGYFLDSNGVLIEDADAPGKPFALLFQFQNDVNATKHVLYNCTAARPGIEGKTKEENVEPETESFDIEAGSVPVTIGTKTYNIPKASSTDTTTAAQVTGWFENVYLPTALPA